MAPLPANTKPTKTAPKPVKIPARVRQAWLEQAKSLSILENSYYATPELITELCTALAHGSPMFAAAKACGIHPDTVKTWGEKDPAFLALIERAEADGINQRVKRLCTDPDPKWASWILARHPRTRDHFRLSDQGRAGGARVEINFGFSRSGAQNGPVIEHEHKLLDVSD